MPVRKRTWRSGGEAKSAWVADYRDQAGKRHLKTFRTKKEADSWLVTARHEVARGVHTTDHASITVQKACQLWLQRAELNKLERATTDKYRNHVDRYIAPLIGSVRLSRLSTPAVEEFRNEVLRRASWPMAKKVLTSLKGVLAEAVRRGMVGQNVAAPVRIDSRKRERRRLVVGRDVPEKSEMAAILAAAAGRWRPLIIMAAFTGLRSSELRGLTWDDVDLTRRLINVRQRADQWGKMGPPKSEAGHRSVPMSPMVVAALEEWRPICPRVDKTEDNPGRLWLVFPSGRGKPESHSNIISRGLDPIQIAAGVTSHHPSGASGTADGKVVGKYALHSFRHFFAAWAIEQGFSPKRLQALLGHASIQMTFDVYGHLFPTPEDDHAKFAAGEFAVMNAQTCDKTATQCGKSLN